MTVVVLWTALCRSALSFLIVLTPEQMTWHIYLYLESALRASWLVSNHLAVRTGIKGVMNRGGLTLKITDCCHWTLQRTKELNVHVAYAESPEAVSVVYGYHIWEKEGLNFLQMHFHDVFVTLDRLTR